MEITKSFKTIAHTTFGGSVSRDENPAAHGNICLLQVKRTSIGMMGRRVNVNGLHQEVGTPFYIDAQTFARWEMMGKDNVTSLK